MKQHKKGFRCQQIAYKSGFMKLPFKVVWERFPTAIIIDPPPADSMLDVGRSMFDVHWFLYSIRLDSRGQRPR